jgi:hypothetical protein
MPIPNKAELVDLLENMNQQNLHTSHNNALTRLNKTPEHSDSLISLPELPKLAATPPARVLKSDLLLQETVPFGISGRNFKPIPAHHLRTAIAKSSKAAEDQEKLKCSNETKQIHKVAGSESLLSSDEAILNRSSSGGAGAAIKAALGSGLFASFRRASLASVLQKVKATVDEQVDASAELIFKSNEDDKLILEELFDAKPNFNHKDEALNEVPSKDRVLFEIEQRSHPGIQNSESRCCDSKNAKFDWNQDIEIRPEGKSSSRRIQKSWNFECIRQATVQSPSGLKTKTDSERRPNSAAIPNASLLDYTKFDFSGSNPNVTPRQTQGLGAKRIQNRSDKCRVEDLMMVENKTRQPRASMGPGGFWRVGLHSASSEVIQRKMSDFVANIPEMKQQISKCGLCLTVGKKGKSGCCEKCGSQYF